MFWPISETHVLLGPKFTKASLGHEPDGLIFQPSDEPYKPGRDDQVILYISIIIFLRLLNMSISLGFEVETRHS